MYRKHQQSDSNAIDLSLQSFLELLQRLRIVLIQDLAMIYSEAPTCKIYEYSPFNSPIFRQFANEAPSRVGTALARADRLLKNLPEVWSETIKGIFHTSVAENEELSRRLIAEIQDLKSQIAYSQANAEFYGQPPSKRAKQGRY